MPEFSFRISNFVLPRETRISCPLVPEKDPTTAAVIDVGADNVRLRRCKLDMLGGMKGKRRDLYGG